MKIDKRILLFTWKYRTPQQNFYEKTSYICKPFLCTVRYHHIQRSHMLLVWIVGNDEFSLNRFCHFPSQFLIDLPSISMEVKFVIIIRPHAGIIMKGDVVKSDFDKKESRLWSFNRVKYIGVSISIWSSTLTLFCFFAWSHPKKKRFWKTKTNTYSKSLALQGTQRDWTF